MNNLANFCHRTLSLLRAKFEGKLVPPSDDAPAKETWKAMESRFQKVVDGYGSLDFREAVLNLVEIGNAGNLFLQQRKPWELGATAHGDLSLCANGALAVAVLLSPVVPKMAEAVLGQLGSAAKKFSRFKDLTNGPWLKSGMLEAGPASLMPRVEVEQARALLPESDPAAPQAEKKKADQKSEKKPVGPISFEQFAVVELRCGLVVAAEKVEGASKLLKLQVDLGEGAPRTIASGIAEAFAPEALVGKRVVVVANLAPRTIRGIESRGMLLATGDGAESAWCRWPTTSLRAPRSG